jgi:hypothetical protein
MTLHKRLQDCPNCTHINKHGVKCIRKCLNMKDEPNPVCARHQNVMSKNHQCSRMTNGVQCSNYQASRTGLCAMHSSSRHSLNTYYKKKALKNAAAETGDILKLFGELGVEECDQTSPSCSPCSI